MKNIIFVVVFIFGCTESDYSTIEKYGLREPPEKTKLNEEQGTCVSYRDCPNIFTDSCEDNICVTNDVTAVVTIIMDNDYIDKIFKGSIVSNDHTYFYLVTDNDSSVLIVDWYQGSPTVSLSLREFMLTGTKQEEFDQKQINFKTYDKHGSISALLHNETRQLSINLGWQKVD